MFSETFSALRANILFFREKKLSILASVYFKECKLYRKKSTLKE